MAKGNKTAEGKSVLRASYEAFERGDVVTARSLAKEVLAGRVGKDDASAAEELSKKLSSDEAKIDATPEAIAKELVSRTIVPPRPYIFVGAIVFAFVALMTLALTRY
jgi:hypothetical protein